MTVVTALREDSRVGVIDAECRGKTLGGMTGATIRCGDRVDRHRR